MRLHAGAAFFHAQRASRCTALRKHMPAMLGTALADSARTAAHAMLVCFSQRLIPLHPAAGVTSCTWWTLCAAAWCSSPSFGRSSSCAMPAVRAAAWAVHLSSL